ncbi:MAG TPA: hypothetical protein VNA31_04870 [bacterium]|nr:hypothetical protein [bacterium]
MKRAVLLLIVGVEAAGHAQAASQAPQIQGLVAPAPNPVLADKLALFGQFIGDWDCDVVTEQPNGSRISGRCEWHWGWIIDGRAVQDVWIAYGDTATHDPRPTEYGTTLRFYDSRIGAWHVIYIGPVHNNLSIFTARKQGEEIVLQSAIDSGRVGQWIFSQITRDSFHWRGQGSNDSGRTWHVFQEMQVRRVGAPR